jgi:hypothetical protein
MLRLRCDGSHWKKAKDKDDGDWRDLHESPRSHSQDKSAANVFALPAQVKQILPGEDFVDAHGYSTV